MSIRWPDRKTLATLALLAAPLPLATCVSDPETLLGAQCQGDFGGGEAGLKVRAIIGASTALIRAAEEVERDTNEACRAMAGELAIPASELSMPAAMVGVAGGETRFVCQRVKREIDEIMATFAPEVKVSIVATPAVCTIDAQLRHSCIETCEQKNITETELMCKPGRISGQCTASCTGTCSGGCSATCSGQCSATCKGTCSGNMRGRCTGTCSGACEGTCSAMNAQGQCAGQCEGTCHGTCSAEIEGECGGTCEGSCSASCQGSCSGECTGTCTGGCSGTFQAPYCEEVEVTRTVTECERSCDTQARAQATCTEPSLTVTVLTNVAEERTKAQKLLAAFRQGLPRLLKVTARASGTVQSSATAFVGNISAVPDASLQAGQCLVAAGQASLHALGQINASVEVSVQIQASATLRAGP